MQRLFKTTLITISFLFAVNSSAQAYYEIAEICTEEVFDQMNLNKRAGIEILTNVEANHTLAITGVNISNKIQLENILDSESKIKNYALTSDLSKLNLTCKATLTNDEIEQFIIEQRGLILRHSIEYYVFK